MFSNPTGPGNPEKSFFFIICWLFEFELGISWQLKAMHHAIKENNMLNSINVLCRGSADENISKTSALENTCKPGAIKNIINYYKGNPITSKCHRKHMD